MKKNFRTDLALEAHKLSQSDGEDIEGVIVRTEKDGDISISHLEITNKHGSDALGKGIGKYITIEYPDLKYSTDNIEHICSLISNEIRSMSNISNDSTTLVVGLGNRAITPDALGTEVVERLLVTNHFKKHMENELTENLSSVCAIAPGVLGTTGMESSEIIKSITEMLKPDLVIVIDALAAAGIEHVASTVQISNAGIQPGAGVGNNRDGINKETLGIDVIAIGVPTVIDAQNIAEIPENISPLMVTTTDIDTVIKQCAKTIAGGINTALHKDMTFEKIMELTA